MPAVHVRWSIPVVLVLGLSGCAEDKPAERPASSTSRPAAQRRQPPLEAPAEPGADAAVRRVIEGLRNDDPEVLWLALPKSYRRDAAALLHGFAAEVDPAVWDRSFEVLERAVRVLKEQKQFVLSRPMIVSLAADQPEQIEQDYDVAVSFLETIAASDLAEIARLKSVDVGKLLDQTGGRLMAQASAFSRLLPGDPFNTGFKHVLGEIDVTASEAGGATAMVIVRLPEAELEERVPFVRIDGKWLPKPLIDSWDVSMDQARTKLQTVAEVTRRSRSQILERLDRAEQVFDRMLAAESQAAFDAAVAELTNVVQLMPKGREADSAAPSPEPSGDTVLVVVPHELGAAEEEALQLRLSALTDNGQGLAIPRLEQGRTVFEVAPVTAVRDFASRIDFTRVTKVDPAKRMILLEPPVLEEPPQ